MRLTLLTLLITAFIFTYSQEKTRRIPVTTADGTKATVEVDNLDKKIKPKKQITYAWYKAKTILYTQGAYQGSLLHGIYQENYANHQLKVQGSYRYGVKSGTWRYWNEKGELIKEEKWKKGQPIVAPIASPKKTKQPKEKNTTEKPIKKEPLEPIKKEKQPKPKKSKETKTAKELKTSKSEVPVNETPSIQKK